jgi:ATP-dependent Clp protease ATP-binding subunit ClpC
LKAKALEIKNQKVEVVKNQRYEEAAELRDKERKVLARLDEEKRKFEEGLTTKKKVVPIELVYDVVSNMTKIPVSKLNADDTKALIDLEVNLNDRVIGQSDAVKRISKSIRRNRLGIKDPNRPIGSFIFLGSTGVGKTYLAKQLAKEVFGSVDNLIRMDMSEYQEKHTVSRLIGAPPGYVGYDEGGQLTEQVKNKPYSVILFDEIEKANKDIFSSLLQMLDDGHMTDGLGRKINFKNCIIIMTSNLGIKKLQDFGNGVGFSNSNNAFVNEELRKQTLQKELKKFFAPVFLNRIDDTIIFNSLGQNDVDKIVAIELDKLKVRLDSMKYQITFDDSISQMISKVGFDEMYGARPLKRAIQDKVEDYISEEVLKGNIKEGVNVILTTEDGETVSVKVKKKKGS